MPRPKKKPKILKALTDMALEEGYEPGRYVIQHLTEMKARLAAWRYNIEKYGQPPEEYAGTDLDEFMTMYAREAAEMFKLETQVMEYFHPKMRSTDSSVSVEGELSLLELLTRERGS